MVSISRTPKLTPYSNQCQCSACGRHFLTVEAFELHRVLRQGAPRYRRSCVNPDTQNRRFEQDTQGYWRIPKRTFPEMEAA
jgi:hypothetical protein